MPLGERMLTLPASVCFRVTRYCNARCGFCLAPPDGAHPDRETLIWRLEWIRARGVRTVHFCGGEPTIHPAMAELLDRVSARGGHTRLTTNGISISDELVGALRRCRTDVKVSLHGDREHHNKMVGCDAFEKTTGNLRRLLASGVRTSVQTTVVAGAEGMWEWVVWYCRQTGIKKLSVLPFIPRGSGYERRDRYELSGSERALLRERVRRLRREMSGRLDVKWLDFTATPVPVIEADGRVVMEGPTEGLDQTVCAIPVATLRESRAESASISSLLSVYSR